MLTNIHLTKSKFCVLVLLIIAIPLLALTQTSVFRNSAIKPRVHRGELWQSTNGSSMRIIVGTSPKLYAFSPITFEFSPNWSLSSEDLYRHLHDGVWIDRFGIQHGEDGAHEAFERLEVPAYKNAILAIVGKGAREAEADQDKLLHMFVTSALSLPGEYGLSDENVAGAVMVSHLRRLFPGIHREILQSGRDTNAVVTKYNAALHALQELAQELEGTDQRDMLANIAGAGLATFNEGLCELWVGETYIAPLSEE